MSASQEAGSPIAIGWARFNLGAAYMLRGNFEEAENYLHAAVTLGEQTGDIMLQAKSLAFLTLVCRRRGQVLETQHSNVLAEGLAQRVQDAEFLGMAKATSDTWRPNRRSLLNIRGLACARCQPTVIFP